MMNIFNFNYYKSDIEGRNNLNNDLFDKISDRMTKVIMIGTVAIAALVIIGVVFSTLPIFKTINKPIFFSFLGTGTIISLIFFYKSLKKTIPVTGNPEGDTLEEFPTNTAPKNIMEFFQHESLMFFPGEHHLQKADPQNNETSIHDLPQEMIKYIIDHFDLWELGKVAQISKSFFNYTYFIMRDGWNSRYKWLTTGIPFPIQFFARTCGAAEFPENINLQKYLEKKYSTDIKALARGICEYVKDREKRRQRIIQALPAEYRLVPKPIYLKYEKEKII